MLNGYPARIDEYPRALALPPPPPSTEAEAAAATAADEAVAACSVRITSNSCDMSAIFASKNVTLAPVSASRSFASRTARSASCCRR